MAKQRVRFVSGAREKGHPQKKIEKIFDLMEQFAGYGFNKSHSAAYAYLAYVTGYLKAHYPIEFMAALLTSETGNTAKIVKYIDECREMNIRVLPPDVNSSDWTFTPDGEAIRFGLGPIKNLGQGAVEAIQEARTRVGRFRSIYQFCEEVDLNSINRRMIESMVRAGAMDSLDGTRSQFMAVIDAAMEHGQRKRKDAASGQGGLFAMMSQEEEKTSEVLPNVPDWSGMEKLKGEKEMLGFYVTGHPLDDYMDKVSELATHDSETLEAAGLARSAEVAVCGILTTIVRKRNKEGKLWATMQLEDKKGHIETMLFASQYEKNLQFLVEDKAVLVRATVLPEDSGPPRLSAQDITPLDIVRVPFATLVSIRVSLNRQNGDAAGELTELFKRKPGNTAVRLKLDRPRDFSVLLDVPEKIRPDKEFKAEVERICGPEAYEELAR
jgi:DNA polymerase-3 subunit alpha